MRESQRGGPNPSQAADVARRAQVEELVTKPRVAESGMPRIVDACAMPARDWDAMAARSPFGDAFQSDEWGELKRTLGWTPLRYAIEVDGDTIAVVLLQERSILRGGGPLGRLRVHYAPRGPILLRDDREAATAALAGLRAIAAARHSLALTIDPAWREDGAPASALPGSGFKPAAREVQVSRTAMVVPLRADEAEQHALLDGSTSTNINKARRAGVTTERVDLADPAGRDAALADFYEMHAATGRREDFLVRDRDYELGMWRRLGEADLASLWFASLDGRRRSGLLLLHSGRNVVLFAAGSPDDADLRKNRANHLLHWSIMRWAVAAGFAGYDLGGVDTHRFPGLPADESHPLWNLYEFKRRLGAVGEVRIRAHEYAPNAVVGATWRLARRVR
jgi:lipid II:glycine glycyltransferase (peptidoglycan interpeptide bridge formation enzyme)